jgi:hypothetical protein
VSIAPKRRRIAVIRLVRAFGLKRISGKAVSLALIAALVWTAALPLASAQAGHRHGHGGDALAAGVIGFAVGAIIANGANRYSQPLYTYQQPQPIYIQPQPIYIQPQPIYIQPQPQYRPYSGPRYYKSLSHYPVQSRY